MRRLLLCFLLVAAPIAARVPRPASGMVSAADPRAADAGAAMLRQGGSAADAAVAMMLALNVVEPLHSGIGGGSYLLHHDGRSRRLDGYDGRETAPAAADGRWFYRDGQPLSHGAAKPGGRSVGVPGNLRLMALVHRQHGRLPWAALFAPAIRLAQGGFAITPRLHNFLLHYGDEVDGWTRAQYYDAGGTAKPIGTVLTDSAQAALLARIAAAGPDAFYTGPVAAQIVATVNGADRNPSRMQPADLASYRALPRPPVCGRYRGYRVCGPAPSSAGGVTVLEILKQLEPFDLGRLGRASPVAWHLFAEASRLAYADRDTYLADPAFVAVPVAGLLDPAYLRARSRLIRPDRTMASVAPGEPVGAPRVARADQTPEHGTSDMAATDRWGDVVQVTSTIEGVFGSGLSVQGTMLNNELTDFDFVPERNGLPVANRVEGGKRPRSSMAPTIVYAPDGRVRLAIGAAGGSTIIAQVAKAIVGVVDWHLSAADAIALPLLYAPGRTAYLEADTPLVAMAPALQALGETVQVAPLGLKANAIEWRDGAWVGAADPRSEGVAESQAGVVTRPTPARRAAATPSE